MFSPYAKMVTTRSGRVTDDNVRAPATLRPRVGETSNGDLRHQLIATKMKLVTAHACLAEAESEMEAMKSQQMETMTAMNAERSRTSRENDRLRSSHAFTEVLTKRTHMAYLAKKREDSGLEERIKTSDEEIEMLTTEVARLSMAVAERDADMDQAARGNVTGAQIDEINRRLAEGNLKEEFEEMFEKWLEDETSSIPSLLEDLVARCL